MVDFILMIRQHFPLNIMTEAQNYCYRKYVEVSMFEWRDGAICAWILCWSFTFPANTCAPLDSWMTILQLCRWKFSHKQTSSDVSEIPSAADAGEFGIRMMGKIVQGYAVYAVTVTRTKTDFHSFENNPNSQDSRPPEMTPMSVSYA